MGIQPMKVVVSRHGGLWEGVTSGDWKTGRGDVQVPEGATVADLLRLLGMDRQLVCMIVVDGQASTLEARLAEGSTVDLIPPIVGG